MKKYKKLFLIIIIILLIYSKNILASIDQSFVDVGSKMTFDRIYNEAVLSITESNVKMTQDDNKYYFEVSQDMVNWSSFSGNYQLNYMPSFIVTNRSDTTTLKVYIQEAMNTLERTEKVYFHEYSSGNRDLLSDYYRDYKGNVRRDSHSVSYYIHDAYLKNNNPNVEVISLIRTGDGNIGEIFNLTTKFSIKKDSLESVRYFSFLFNVVYTKLTSNGYTTSDVKCGVTNYAIDLMQYTECNHEFELRECDKEKHIIYCNKCEWLIDGKHNFDISYDDIENDECICGYRKQIRMIHKNNLNNLITYRLATPNEIIEYEDNSIKGHTLLYYEDMELLNNNWDLATKSIIYTLPNNVPTNSHIYTAIYKVNSYYINYSNVNNLNLSFDNRMDSVKLAYGQKYNLDNNLYVKTGYNFLGWSIRPDIDKKVFDNMQEIESLSDIDGDIVHLHPVFFPYEYTIHYIDNRYGKNYYKQYSYNVIEYLDINKNLHTSDKFEGFKINGKIRYVKDTSDILQFVLNDKDIITLEASYIVDINNHEIVTNQGINIISESDEYLNTFSNELPIVEKSNVGELNKKNIKLKDNSILDNDLYFDEYDNGIVDIFLGANISILNNYIDKNRLDNHWMTNINNIILKIKELITNNGILRKLLVTFIVISINLIVFCVIFILIYYIKKYVKEEKNKDSS